MRKKSKKINWVLLGYSSIIAIFLLFVLAIFIKNTNVLVLALIPWLFWLFDSIYLLTKAGFRLHGILLLILWIPFSLFMYYMLMWPPPPPILIEAECRARLTSQCAICYNLDWSGKPPQFDKTLLRCEEKYWYDKAPRDFNDCSLIKEFCDEIVGDIYL